MGRKSKRRSKPRNKQRKGSSSVPTHHQAKYHSLVYRDGKCHVYTAWNDNEEDVGAEMSREDWNRMMRNAGRSGKRWTK